MDSIPPHSKNPTSLISHLIPKIPAHHRIPPTPRIKPLLQNHTSHLTPKYHNHAQNSTTLPESTPNSYNPTLLCIYYSQNPTSFPEYHTTPKKPTPLIESHITPRIPPHLANRRNPPTPRITALASPEFHHTLQNPTILSRIPPHS
jgi:hypothetical protein